MAKCDEQWGPLSMQLFAMVAAAASIVFSVLGFVHFNPAWLVVHVYILLTGVLLLLADIRCIGFFSYVPFIYTRPARITKSGRHYVLFNALGRGLTLVLLGAIFIQESLLKILGGSFLIAAGILYFIVTKRCGGVPRPLTQRNTPTPLDVSDCVNFIGGSLSSTPYNVEEGSARAMPQGFRT